MACGGGCSPSLLWFSFEELVWDTSFPPHPAWLYVGGAGSGYGSMLETKIPRQLNGFFGNFQITVKDAVESLEVNYAV